MPGAASLATSSALKSGCGLVTLHSVVTVCNIVAVTNPSAMLSICEGPVISVVPDLSKCNVVANPSGAGKVYAKYGNSNKVEGGTSSGADSQKSTHTYTLSCDANNGYIFDTWTNSSGTLTNATTQNGATWSVTANTTESNATGTCTAKFSPVSATLTNNVVTTLEKGNVTLSALFATNADALADFAGASIAKQTGNGTFSNASCASVSGGTLTVNYDFNAGGATGEHTAELTINRASSAGSTAAIVTVHVASLGEAEGTGVATENLTQVVHGSATIATKYVTSQSQINTPTITNKSGSGVFTIDTWSWANNLITINYSFDPQGTEGTTTADLNISLNAATGDSKVFQLMATATAPVAYEAEVEVGSEIVKTGTWTECLAYANTLSTNPTLRLRNAVSGIKAKQSITKSMTLDLNSQAISGALTTADGMLDINGTGITVTITDNSPKKEGKISNISASGVYLYGVYVTKGTLNFEEGFVR